MFLNFFLKLIYTHYHRLQYNKQDVYGPEHRAYQGALLVHGQSEWDTCTQSSRANSSIY